MNNLFDIIILIGVLIFLITTIIIDQKNRTKFFSEFINEIPVGSNVLDFGGANCDLKYFLKNRNNVTTIDIYKGCDSALIYDGYKLPFKDNTFDIVCSIFVLHHIPHYEEILPELVRVCKNKLIILEDYPETFYQIMISKLHYLLFDQPMSSIKYMNSPDIWCKLLGTSSHKKIKTNSLFNTTPHYLITKKIHK
tara:strand:- start:47 stop:628 length:582 start_codon:yes stop_codon:yes gene_type:complete